MAWLSHYCPALPTKSKLLSNAVSLLVSIYLLCFNSFSLNTKYLFFATGPDIDFVTEMLGFISIIYVAYKCVRACARVVVFMQSISGVRRKFPGGAKVLSQSCGVTIQFYEACRRHDYSRCFHRKIKNPGRTPNTREKPALLLPKLVGFALHCFIFRV